MMMQGPAFVVHNDYTAASAPRRLQNLAKPPAVNDTLYHILKGQPLLDPETLPKMLKRRCQVDCVWSARIEVASAGGQL